MNKFKKMTILTSSLTFAVAVPITTVILVNKNKKPNLPNNNAQANKLQTQYNDLLQEKTKLKDQIKLISNQQQEINNLIQEVSNDKIKQISELIITFNDKIVGKHTKLMINEVEFYIVKFNSAAAEGKDNGPIFSSIAESIPLTAQKIIPVEQMDGFLKASKDTEKQSFILARVKEIEASVKSFLDKKNVNLKNKEIEFNDISSQLKDITESLSKAQKNLTSKEISLKEKNTKIQELENKNNILQEEILDFKKNYEKTIYKDKQGNIKSTFVYDMSEFEVTEILQIGYYKTIDDNIIAVRMPKSIKKVPNYLPEQITSTESMFQNASSFNQDISDWNTKNVTNMSSMFRGASLFNQNLNWNTSKVTDMSRTFEFATKFNGNINNWDVLKVKTFYATFYEALSFDQDISGWKTSNVTNMQSMFNKAHSFNQNISGWKTSNVTNMQYMFQYSNSFNQNLSSWDVSKVNNSNAFASNATKWTLPKPNFR